MIGPRTAAARIDRLTIKGLAAGPAGVVAALRAADRPGHKFFSRSTGQGGRGRKDRGVHEYPQPEAGVAYDVEAVSFFTWMVCEGSFWHEAAIPEEAMPFVYDRFFRAAPPGAEGAGLGLAIAKSTAEQHGLRLSHQNRDDIGGIIACVSF